MLGLGAGLGALTALREAQAQSLEKRQWPQALLTTPSGAPLRAASLRAETNYIFHYPHLGTPCFLIRLGFPVAGGETLNTALGARYSAPAGVGPDRSIVAFSAICAHQLTYAARRISFINYRPGPSKFSAHAHRITCCAHGSVYDPLQGARVVGGPAPQPLAAIVLDYRPDDDSLTATDIAGATMFHDYFKAYKRELRDEFGRARARRPVDGTCPVMPLAEYTRRMVVC